MGKVRSRRSLLGMIVLAAAILVPGLLLPAGPAAAHAILLESVPAANASVAGPSVSFSLRYNSRIDKGRSKLTLTAPDQTETRLPISADGADDVLATATTLSPGSYWLHWQVLAIDGHITRGDVPFTVTAPAGAAPADPAPAATGTPQ